MSNMSYCMFENTYKDLLQCQEALDDGKELSEEETDYKKRLISLCKEIVEEHGEN